MPEAKVQTAIPSEQWRPILTKLARLHAEGVEWIGPEHHQADTRTRRFLRRAVDIGFLERRNVPNRKSPTAKAYRLTAAGFAWLSPPTEHHTS